MSPEVFRLSPTSGVTLNPTQFVTRANTFASSATASGPFTLLVTATATTVADYVLITDEAATSRAELQIAQAVGARATPAVLPETIADAEVLGHLRAVNGSPVRATQFGADPSDLAAAVVPVLAPGEWVAVTARTAHPKETKAHTAWLAHKLGSTRPIHHSTAGSAVVVSVRAGAATRDRVASLLRTTSAAMPGFDVATKPVVEPTRHRTWKSAPAGAVLLAAAVTAAVLLGSPALPYAAAAAALAAGLIGLGVLALTGRITSPADRLATQLAAGNFPAPRRRRHKPRPPREASTETVKNDDGTTTTKHISASAGDYPVEAEAFYVGPSVIAGLVSPHIGAAAGDVSLQVRATSPAMSERCGFNLGSNDGVHTYIPATDANGGIAVVGKPNSGKSYFLQAYFGYCARERVAPSGLDGYPGAANTVIAFESKDAAPAYQQWAQRMGDKTLLVDVADPARAAIDFFSCPGVQTIEEKATMVVDAMEYAWGEVSIGARSRETLSDLLTAALVVDDELLATIPDRDELNLPTAMSPFYYLYVLLGARGGDTVATSLAAAITARSTVLRERGHDAGDFAVAAGALSKLYGPGVTPAARRSFLEAPRNKVMELYLTEQFFSPARRKVTFHQALTTHKSMIVNTGVSATGKVLAEAHADTLSAMMMYLLYRNILTTCSGWQRAGRRVTIIADELSTLAGNNEMVLGWFRDKGRSYGVEAVLGTQRPEQLPKDLRNNLMTYSTLISFAQSDTATAAEMAANVSGQGVSFTADEILGLPRYHAVIRAHAQLQRQPAAVVAVHDFAALGDTFLDLHFATPATTIGAHQ